MILMNQLFWKIELRWMIGPHGWGSYAVYDNNIDWAAPNEGVHKAQCLLSIVGLWKEQVICLHTDGFCQRRIEGVFGIYERTVACIKKILEFTNPGLWWKIK